LREGRPVRIGLEALSNLFIFENIHEREWFPDRIQRGNRLPGEPTLREIRRTLHKQQNVM